MGFDNSNPPPVRLNDYGRRLNRDKPHIYLFGGFWRLSPWPGNYKVLDDWAEAMKFTGSLNNERKGFKS